MNVNLYSQDNFANFRPGEELKVREKIIPGQDFIPSETYEYITRFGQGQR